MPAPNGATERMFHALFVHRERGLTAHELADAMYATDPDGGPLDALNSIYMLVHQLNKQLIPLGAKIVSDPPRGGPGARRRLVML